MGHFDNATLRGLIVQRLKTLAGSGLAQDTNATEQADAHRDELLDALSAMVQVFMTKATRIDALNAYFPDDQLRTQILERVAASGQVDNWLVDPADNQWRPMPQLMR